MVLFLLVRTTSKDYIASADFTGVVARSEGGATRIVGDRDRGVGESCSCEASIVENRNTSDSGLLYAEVQTGSKAL